MKVAIYIRVSTDRQDNSLELQKSKCVTFCESKGYEIVDIIVDEDISGGSKIFNRPGGKTLKKLIESNSVSQLVCWKLDRLSRKVVDGLTFIEELNKKSIGISIIDMKGETIDTNTATGKFFLTIMLSLNEMERGIVSERTSSVLQNKKANLEVYSNKALYGFKKQGKKLVPVSSQLDKVRKVLNLSKNRSKRSLSIELVLGYKVVQRIIRDEEFYLSHL